MQQTMKNNTSTTRKIDFKEMPSTFTLCTRTDCARHESCLHWLAYDKHPVMERMYFYDSRWFDLHGGTDACPHYADCTPIVYAAGFERIFDDMPKAKAEDLRQSLLRHFGAYTYYRYRRGEFLMSPDAQEYILSTAKELGITTPIRFRKKENHHRWNDSHILGDKD